MKREWKVVLECNDDDDMPTVWATNTKSLGYVWIEKYNKKEYHITKDNEDGIGKELKVCKSLTSAKTWVARNII